MATRFYLQSTGDPGVAPAWSTDWDDTSIASPEIRPCFTSKAGTALTEKSFTSGDGSNADADYAFFMFVSPELAAQSLPAQTVTISISGSETTSSNNQYLHWQVRVWRPDGTFQAVVPFRGDDTELPTTAASRFDTLTSTAATLLDGDRLVIEIGIGGDPAKTNDRHYGAFTVGDAAASDLDAADNDTGADNPWVNFATTTLALRRRRVYTT
jgi:hypothetical protein